jgi:hypothetical protein
MERAGLFNTAPGRTIVNSLQKKKAAPSRSGPYQNYCLYYFLLLKMNRNARPGFAGQALTSLYYGSYDLKKNKVPATLYRHLNSAQNLTHTLLACVIAPLEKFNG